MRRRRNGRQTTGVSLFPFLAVLVCTMGALIVLLVLVVQQARVQATVISQQRSANAGQRVEERQRLLQVQEDYQWRRDILQQQRASELQRLAQRRLELSHLEDHIRSLEQTWRSLRENAASLDQSETAGKQQLDEARRQLQSVRAAIETAKKKLDQTRRQADQHPRSYAIIPYDGPHGTRRRPIYLECQADRIVLRPEGIVLQADDFDGPGGPGNPLDAALRAIREYWSRHGGSDQGEPYPLLIIRPDGAAAYSAARSAMKAWDDEFGYELVGADVHLAYPAADLALKNLLDKTIADARQRQAALAAAMPSRFPPRQAAGFRVDTQRGGLRPIGGEEVEEGAFSTSRSTFIGSHHPHPVTAGPPGAGRSGSDDRQHAANAMTGPPGGGPSRFGIPHRPDAAAAGQPGAESLAFDASNRPDAVTPEQAGAGRSDFGEPHRSVAATTAQPGAGGWTAPQQVAGQGIVGQGGDGGPGSTPPATLRGAASTPGASTSSGGGFRPGAASLHHSAAKPKDWALPNESRGLTAITRPIRVVCTPDQLVILPDQGQPLHPVATPLAGPTRHSIDAFVSRIWDHMERWGIAVTGGYWKPLLRVEVTPGGEQRFADLQALLDGSGIEIERKQR